MSMEILIVLLTFSPFLAGFFDLIGPSDDDEEVASGEADEEEDTRTDILGDVLMGTELAEALNGSIGNDEIDGGDGDDTLTGFGGDDTLSGDGGEDILYGRDGNDVLDGGAGNDIVNGNSGNDVLAGGEGDDTLDGGTGDNVLRGGTGADLLQSAEGNDVLRATGEGQASDTDADTLQAGDGNDTLSFAGGDTATGGAGADTFILREDAISTGTVTDYSAAEDMLVFQYTSDTAPDVASQEAIEGGMRITLSNGQSLDVLGATGPLDVAGLGFVQVAPIETPS